jgi:hypothetical protein
MSEMKRQPRILVTVVDDAASPKCEARCGLDLSSPETFNSTADVLLKLFGSRVKIEHISLAAIGNRREGEERRPCLASLVD